MSSDAHFRAFIDRIRRCREAEDEAKEDTKAVYAELKAAGYDKTVAGALVNELRKQEKNGDKFEEHSALLDLYRDAYHRASGTVATHVYAREAKARIEIIDSETGEIHDTQDQPETATGSGRTAQVCGEGMAPPLPAGAADAVCSTPAASVSDAIARKDHQSVSPSSPDGSASTESAAGKVSGPAQPSPPKQAEPIKAGALSSSLSVPAILSDEEVVPAFMKNKQSREAA